MKWVAADFRPIIDIGSRLCPDPGVLVPVSPDKLTSKTRVPGQGTGNHEEQRG